MRLEIHSLDLRLKRPFTIARGSRTVAANVLVELHAEGLVGRGEAAPSPRYGQSQASAREALEAFARPAAAHPLDPLPVLGAFDRQFPGQTAARAALEMALWDWAGQRIGQPLCRMLAIDPSQTPSSSYTISLDTPEAIAQQVREAADWPILKVKLGGGDQDEDIVRQLREVTDRPFRVDANEAWDEAEAREKIAWLAGQGCELVEQPLPAGDLDGMALLHERSALPLVADEDAPDAAAVSDLVGRFHGVNVKLMKCGGVREAVRMIHTARQMGLDAMLGCFVESSVAITAAAHLSPLARWVDLDGAALLAEDPFVGAEVDAGQIILPTRPGLGVAPAGG